MCGFYVNPVNLLSVADTENGVTLHTRDVVRVIGVSSQRGRLKVVHCGRTFHLPSHMLLLQVCLLTSNHYTLSQFDAKF